MQFKLGQKIIDVLRNKKNKQIADINKIKAYESDKIKTLKAKIKNGEKIKVAFLHMYATDTQNLSVFDKMLESDIFDPYFIINPDISRSTENFNYNYKRTIAELTTRYGENRVLNGYNYETKTFIDYTGKFDIATTNNPYDLMAHKYFKIQYWVEQKIPVFYIPYFFMGRCHVTIDNFKMYEFNLLWKVFVENENTFELSKKYELIKGKNIVISGYPKLDKISVIKKENYQRKRIIIAPHHTINNSKLSVGGFLQYYNVIQNLPKKYPQLDFIFRPHPLLFEALKKDEFWGCSKAEKWLNDFLQNDNVTYSTEGDYLNLFVNSDALIHDCGSFMAEYLYLNHPCAYLYRNGAEYSKIHTKFGFSCLKHHYSVHTEQDLYNFIENVVIAGNDYKKSARYKFAKNEIMTNFPNSTDYIISYLQKTLTGGRE